LPAGASFRFQHHRGHRLVHHLSPLIVVTGAGLVRGAYYMLSSLSTNHRRGCRAGGNCRGCRSFPPWLKLSATRNDLSLTGRRPRGWLFVYYMAAVKGAEPDRDHQRRSHCSR
jgi:hypothetical protein